MVRINTLLMHAQHYSLLQVGVQLPLQHVMAAFSALVQWSAILYTVTLMHVIAAFLAPVYCSVCRGQCVTRSLFQFSRREQEFLSFNLVLRDKNKNFFFQSQALRRERESRLGQFSREFLRITYIALLLTNIFKKMQVICQMFEKFVFFSQYFFEMKITLCIDYMSTLY